MSKTPYIDYMRDNIIKNCNKFYIGQISSMYYEKIKNKHIENGFNYCRILHPCSTEEIAVKKCLNLITKFKSNPKFINIYYDNIDTSPTTAGYYVYIVYG